MSRPLAADVDGSIQPSRGPDNAVGTGCGTGRVAAPATAPHFALLGSGPWGLDDLALGFDVEHLAAAACAAAPLLAPLAALVAQYAHGSTRLRLRTCSRRATCGFVDWTWLGTRLLGASDAMRLAEPDTLMLCIRDLAPSARSKWAFATARVGGIDELGGICAEPDGPGFWFWGPCEGVVRQARLPADWRVAHRPPPPRPRPRDPAARAAACSAASVDGGAIVFKVAFGDRDDNKADTITGVCVHHGIALVGTTFSGVQAFGRARAAGEWSALWTVVGARAHSAPTGVFTTQPPPLVWSQQEKIELDELRERSQPSELYELQVAPAPDAWAAVGHPSLAFMARFASGRELHVSYGDAWTHDGMRFWVGGPIDPRWRIWPVLAHGARVCVAPTEDETTGAVGLAIALDGGAGAPGAVFRVPYRVRPGSSVVSAIVSPDGALVALHALSLSVTVLQFDRRRPPSPSKSAVGTAPRVVTEPRSHRTAGRRRPSGSQRTSDRIQ